MKEFITINGYGVKDRIARKFIDYVFPENFGAVGNGITDDTAAIQAALTEAEVAETLAQAKAVIDGIKTKAQYEAEEAEAAAKALEAVKTTAKEELASYKSSELYREAEQAQLAQAVEAGKAAVYGLGQELVADHVIPRPHSDVEKLLPAIK